jgi:hypothetical protein
MSKPTAMQPALLRLPPALKPLRLWAGYAYTVWFRPHDPYGWPACVKDPTTWSSLPPIEEAIHNDLLVGAGVMLGEVDAQPCSLSPDAMPMRRRNGRQVIGVRWANCFRNSRELPIWGMPIIELLSGKAWIEIAPDGDSLNAVAIISTDHVRPLEEALHLVPGSIGARARFRPPGGVETGIEIYLREAFFALCGSTIPQSAPDVGMLDTQTVERLGSAFAAFAADP